jgi:hypothetical protein
MAKKIKKYKVGLESETYAISLVEEGAIESDFVRLAKEDEEKRQVFLESNEKHLVVGAALIPDKDIYRNDGEHEYYINFSKESIEKMSQEFMKEYRQHEIKTDHEDVANEVYVVESWIVADSYKDKSNALGITVPEGSWMVSMKVNNIDTWDRIKAGELKGFSVESVVSLEEFSKQNDNNMDIKTDEMFWTKLVNVLKETFSKKEETVEEPTEIEPTNIDLEEQTPAPEPEPAPEPAPEPVVEPEPKPEPAPAPAPEPEPEPEPQPEPQNDNHLEELVNSLKDEIKALKEMNTGLQEKIKDLGKQPSANPINVNAKPSAGDTYAAWREQMRAMIG